MRKLSFGPTKRSNTNVIELIYENQYESMYENMRTYIPKTVTTLKRTCFFNHLRRAFFDADFFHLITLF